MRIKSVNLVNQPPIYNFQANDLSDLVVIAGPNGVGKTRLVTSLLDAFRGGNPNRSDIDIELEATCDDEMEAFGGKVASIPKNIGMVNRVLQANKYRRNYKSGVLYFESGRQIKQVQNLGFSFDFADPYVEKVSWDLPMKGLAGRWQDTQHAIFKKIQNQKTSIANRAIELRNGGHSSMNLEFTDPLDPFKDAFRKLLGPKTLKRADLQNQRLLYSEDEQERPVSTLSSGESEVLSIVFDFLLRNPSDCVVFFDEPEVHLHPELLIRMVTTLRSIGKNNQFFFLSHSPDLISSSLDDSVIFLTPKKQDNSNQAISINQTAEAVTALHQLGHSIGVLSLGRKVVVIEGDDASLDKKTYSQILSNKFPDLVLVPGGGRQTVSDFNNIVDSVLDKAIWGVEFFMLTDRDSGPVSTESPRIRQLPRYHLENYFLDDEVLSDCFETIEEECSWLRNPSQINQVLRDLASETVGYAVALQVAHRVRQRCGNVDVMPRGAHAMRKSELINAITKKSEEQRGKIDNILDHTSIDNEVGLIFDEYMDSLSDRSDKWKYIIPGKPILRAFCGRAKMQMGRLRNIYLRVVLEEEKDTFQDIVSIFDDFSRYVK